MTDGMLKLIPLEYHLKKKIQIICQLEVVSTRCNYASLIKGWLKKIHVCYSFNAKHLAYKNVCANIGVVTNEYRFNLY